MPPVAYTVCAILPDDGTRQRYIRWLTGGHIQRVVQGGARHVAVVEISDPGRPLRVEARYLFGSRGDLDRYLSEHAPALRAEGLREFPPQTGVRFERTIGDVVFEDGTGPKNRT